MIVVDSDLVDTRSEMVDGLYPGELFKINDGLALLRDIIGIDNINIVPEVDREAVVVRMLHELLASRILVFHVINEFSI